MKKLISTLGVLFTCISIPALAVVPQKPFYIGVDVGGATMKQSGEVGGVSASDIVPENFLLGNVNAGYQFHEIFAMELGYFRTNEKSKNADVLGVAIATEINYSGITFDVVGNLPLANQFSALGSVGAAYVQQEATVSAAGISVDGDDETTALKLGAGFKYDLNESLALRTKVDFIALEDGFWFYTAGIQYRL